MENFEFSNKDFNGDNIQQMTRIYEHQPSYFGTESLNSYVFSDKLKIQKNLTKKRIPKIAQKIPIIETKLPRYLNC